MRKTKKENRKSWNKVFLLSVAVFFAALITFLVSLYIYSYDSSNTLETKEYYASVNITIDKGGYDLNASALTFGRVAKGGSSTRNLIVKNDYDFPIVAEISARGNIEPLLTFEKEILVKKGETRKVAFSAIARNETVPGFYSGFIEVKIMPFAAK